MLRCIQNFLFALLIDLFQSWLMLLALLKNPHDIFFLKSNLLALVGECGKRHTHHIDCFLHISYSLLSRTK